MGIRDQLVALARLGRIDASTHELDKELQEIPKEVTALRESVTLLEGLLSRERAQLEEAERLREQQDQLVKDAQDGISRAKAKSAKAKNAREAEAVERELEVVRRTLKERETERDRLSAAIASVQKSLTQHETEFSSLRDLLQQKDGETQAKIAELNQKRSEALSGRDDVAKLVPSDLLRRYDAIRGRRGTGVAEARDGICRGCRVALRPMQFIKLQREEAIEQCAQCQRYVYLGSWLDEDPQALEEGEK